MQAIIGAISDFINEYVGENITSSKKNWGFAELSVRTSKGKAATSDQPIPMTINGTGDREQISLDDRYEFISWIRLNNPVRRRLAEEDSWGLKEGKRNVLSLRIVIGHKVVLGEDVIYEIAANLPESLVVSGYELVFLSQEGSIDVNHEEIYNTEFGATLYEHHIFDWNIYVLNLDVEYALCVV